MRALLVFDPPAQPAGLHWGPPSLPRQRITNSDPGAHCAPPLSPRHHPALHRSALHLYSNISLLTHLSDFSLSLSLSKSLITSSFSLHFLTQNLTFNRFPAGEDVNHCVIDVLDFLFSVSEIRIGCFSGFWRYLGFVLS